MLEQRGAKLDESLLGCVEGESKCQLSENPLVPTLFNAGMQAAQEEKEEERKDEERKDDIGIGFVPI